MLGLAKRVECEVHAIDPEQQIGLMSIGTTFHAAEGRRTDRLLRALSGPDTQPMLRPGSGFWNDWQPGTLLVKTEEVARQVGFMGRDVRTVAEIENHPYSPFQKSLRILELALEVLAGTPDLSLNILDSTMPFRRGDVDFAPFLREQRPFLDQLVRARAGKVRLGIGIEASEDVARRMPLRGRPFKAWIEARPWEVVLARLGLPIGQPYGAPHLLAGDIVYAMDRYALSSAITEGVVLTPNAVRALIELGREEQIGIRGVCAAPPGVNEFLTGDPLNGTHAGARLQVRHYAGMLNPHTFELDQRTNARVLSQWVDVQGLDRGPATLALEMNDGARMGVLPFEIRDVSHPLLRSERRDQWTALFEWVGRKSLPCRVVGGVNLYPQLLVDAGGGSALLAVVNLSVDDAVARLAVPALGSAGQVERLTAAGTWVVEEDPSRVTVPAWSLIALRWPPGSVTRQAL